jgi:cysteine sulfinate desulfinase/cysteine desulfurase-like protein
MGISEELSKGTVRFSIGRFTNLFHIEKALSVLKEALSSFTLD